VAEESLPPPSRLLRSGGWFSVHGRPVGLLGRTHSLLPSSTALWGDATQDHVLLATAQPDSTLGSTRSRCTFQAHCCRVLDLDGTRRGQWDEGKLRCAGSGW
jgi:hypothetical protein